MIKIINHSKSALEIGEKHGWMVGARYTNLRDIKNFQNVAFVDIDWKNYNFNKHLDAVRLVRPKMTVARDIENIKDLKAILEEAEMLQKYCERIILVPKALELIENMHLIPQKYILGYSVPSKYGKTEIPISSFKGREVHLLGGRPDVQRKLAEELNVISIDCNRFTLDARFGNYFAYNKFIPHEIGVYLNCLQESFININKIWQDYV